ncbi:MAG: hypothetical protein B7Z73_05785 [Planctomycetia bacterium 21-64-5]|nr:MAG: hypothetical protein B7Z73_05785 [Planctomycetia bacterium 21-64-5]HQU41185.1 hypothetical protein [Pirellulales bacterium]
MSTHSIEPGQRLKVQSGFKTGFVQVLAEAVVPAGYWVCREEGSGQQRVIAQTALFPIAAGPLVVDATPLVSAATPAAA